MGKLQKILVRLVGEQHDMVLSYNEVGVPLNDAAQNAHGIHYPFRFTGYQAEKITVQARLYSPANARFVSKDTHWGLGIGIYGDYPTTIADGALLPSNSAMLQGVFQPAEKNNKREKE